MDNNPLAYVDPSGYTHVKKRNGFKPFLRIVAAVVLAVITEGATSEWVAASAAGEAAGNAAFFAAYDAGFSGTTVLAAETSAIGAVSGFAGAAAGGFVYGGVMGGDLQSALMGAVTAGFSYGIGSVFGSPGGGVSNDVAQTIGNRLAQAAVAQAAQRNGVNPALLNLGFFALSWTGNGLVESRYNAAKYDFLGVANRGFLGLVGLPFDIADAALAMQGYLTASAIDYIKHTTTGGGDPFRLITGHSLGALDVVNLVGQGYALGGGSVYSLPFGKIASGVTVNNGWFDIVNLGFIGNIPNPDAKLLGGCTVFHINSCYR